MLVRCHEGDRVGTSVAGTSELLAVVRRASSSVEYIPRVLDWCGQNVTGHWLASRVARTTSMTDRIARLATQLSW